MITPDRARKLIREHDNHRPKALLAAAPDLAQTVIDQGKRIEELEKQNAELRATDTSEWGY